VARASNAQGTPSAWQELQADAFAEPICSLDFVPDVIDKGGPSPSYDRPTHDLWGRTVHRTLISIKNALPMPDLRG